MAEAPIVGRDHEIERLTAAIEDAVQGRGSIWYLTGEPGIGKSRLAEEAARIGRERGMRTFWGRCWEAGGAPPYWPWVQVLRALFRSAEPQEHDRRTDVLGRILPELSTGRPELDASDLGTNPLRLQLMDAVGSVLADAAQHLPLLLVLEDLHVADISTVLLLEFLSGTVPAKPLMIVGTFEEAGLASTRAGPRLLHAAQEGQRLSLARLTQNDVASLLRDSGETTEPELVHVFNETTKGLPLFLVEAARLWRAERSPGTGRTASIPSSLRTTIEARLRTVTPACAETLRRGAIVGREFDIGLLAACDRSEPSVYVEGAQEGTDAALLVEVAPQRYRFAHFLVREVVYEGIPDPERAAAHARLAQVLEARARQGEHHWSEIAHHLVAAERWADASRAFAKAGSRALRQLACEEAVQAYQNALGAADEAGGLGQRRRIELLLELGHAQTRAGDIASGKATCMRAASLARSTADGELLARAALEHGAAPLHSQVDAKLVGLLEDALEVLGPEDSALRARVLARLAAALQPAEDPERPMQLARDAIDMARRLDDPETLLHALRNGGSAMVDFGDLDERVELDRELAALGEELGNPVEALRGNLRSVMDFLALGRVDDAFRATHACERLTEELHHPAHAWRSAALRALRALWEGRLDEAESLVEEARSLGARGLDPNARKVYAMQRARWLQYRGRFDEQIPLLRELEGHRADSEIGRAAARVIAGAEHARAGRLAAALHCFDRGTIKKLLRLGDHFIQLSIAKLCVVAEDREFAEMLHRRMLVTREHLVTGGLLYMTVEGPTSWGLAWLARFLGRDEEASQHYEHALEITRRTSGMPVHGLIALEYAQLLAQSPPEKRARARELAERAEATAAEIGMPALRSDALALLSTGLQSTYDP